MLISSTALSQLSNHDHLRLAYEHLSVVATHNPELLHHAQLTNEWDEGTILAAFAQSALAVLRSSAQTTRLVESAYQQVPAE